MENKEQYILLAEQITNKEITLKQAAKKLNIHESTLRSRMRKMNIQYEVSNSKIILDKDEIKLALEIYEKGASLKKTASYFNITDNALNKNFKMHNIDIAKLNRYGKHTIFTCKKDAFKNINNEAAAYWLGFLLADGYVAKDGWSLELGLKEEDLNHIIKFKQFLNTNNKLRYKPSTKSYIISVSSKDICGDLKRHGVYNNKSLTCLLNEEIMKNEKLKWHYFRGFIDGDGSIVQDKKKLIHLSITSNYDLLNQLKALLPEYYKDMKIIKDKRSNACHISLGNKKTLELLEKCYLNSNIYLERKYKKFIAVYDERYPSIS